MARVRFPVDALFWQGRFGARWVVASVRKGIIGASIAQMVERKTLNLVVVGSIPTGGAFWLLRKHAGALRVRPGGGSNQQ